MLWGTDSKGKGCNCEQASVLLPDVVKVIRDWIGSPLSTNTRAVKSFIEVKQCSSDENKLAKEGRKRRGGGRGQGMIVLWASSGLGQLPFAWEMGSTGMNEALTLWSLRPPILLPG